MDVNFHKLAAGFAVTHLVYLHKEKISEDNVVTRNLIHRNPEWNQTPDHNGYSRFLKLLVKEPLPIQEGEQVSSCTTLINSSNDELRKMYSKVSTRLVRSVCSSLVTVFDETSIKQRKMSRNTNCAKKMSRKCN